MGNRLPIEQRVVRHWLINPALLERDLFSVDSVIAPITSFTVPEILRSRQTACLRESVWTDEGVARGRLPVTIHE